MTSRAPTSHKRGFGRFWPPGMATQLGLLMLLALLASHLLAVLVLQGTGALVHPLAREQALERIGTAYQAARLLAHQDSTRLLATMASPDTRAWISPEPEVADFAMRAEETRLATAIATRLSLAPGLPAWVQLERITGDDVHTPVLPTSGWAPLRLRTSVALPNGLWLNTLQHPPGGYEWGRLLAYSLSVGILPVLLIVFGVIRRLLRPINTLAQATERVSRGEWIAPLPLTGPREARELTAAFNIMQERLARHVEGRTRMLAAISHDFNTPIAELRLQLELLAPSAMREDMLDSLNDLRLMVRETLGFVRGDAVQEPTRTISLTALLDELTRRHRTLGQPLGWQPGPAVYCRCRPLAIKRALGNLIENAMRHGGDAQITLTTEPGNLLRLEILDHGPGIDPAWLDQVFEPFVQLGRGGTDAASGDGLGLGLAIARACIQAHGGELVLENRPPAGLCAIVRLPRGLTER